jgi:hypothetical protein
MAKEKNDWTPIQNLLAFLFIGFFFSLWTGILPNWFTRPLDLDWKLPIRIGDTMHEIHEEIGIPDEGQQAGGSNSMTLQIFREHGMALTFVDDELRSIYLSRLSSSKYGIWKAYEGTIIGGVTLADSMETVQRKLGAPENSDSMKAEANQFVKSWKYRTYRVEIDFDPDSQAIHSVNLIAIPGKGRKLW